MFNNMYFDADSLLQNMPGRAEHSPLFWMISTVRVFDRYMCWRMFPTVMRPCTHILDWESYHEFSEIFERVGKSADNIYNQYTLNMYSFIPMADALNRNLLAKNEDILRKCWGFDMDKLITDKWGSIICINANDDLILAIEPTWIRVGTVPWQVSEPIGGSVNGHKDPQYNFLSPERLPLWNTDGVSISDESVIPVWDYKKYIYKSARYSFEYKDYIQLCEKEADKSIVLGNREVDYYICGVKRGDFV